jgi:hypothetical protein
MLPLYAQMFNPNKAASVQTNLGGSPKVRTPGYGGF